MLLRTLIKTRSIVHPALVPTSQWAKVRSGEPLRLARLLRINNYIL